MKNSILNLVRGLHPTEGMYGIEIEAEGKNLPLDLNRDYWRVERDGSLQAGQEALEYVSKTPTSLEGIRKHLDILQAAYNLNRTRVLDSDTSGVHIHLNVQDYTPRQLFTLATLYFILEELLLKYCGESREGNHFCLRAKDAEYLVHSYCEAAESKNLGNLKNEILRYASFNTCSLFKYGSVEFRAMRGTGNLNAIYEWVEIIDRVRTAALDFPDPAEVARVMSMGGEHAFITRTLRDKADFFLRIPNYAELVKEGVRTAQPLAFAVDWSIYSDRKVNPFR